MHVEPARVQSKWTLPLYWGHLVKGSFISIMELKKKITKRNCD